MEDLRISKTKQILKMTLTDMLNETTFEKLTVSDLCRRAYTSRVTYYTHYDDKYDLVDDMMDGFYKEAVDHYDKLIRSERKEDSPYSGYLCLLLAILELYDNNQNFFKHVSATTNPYLYSSFYKKVFMSVESYMENHTEKIITRYPERETAALLCGGLWAVINESYGNNRSKDETRKYILGMYNSLLRSRLFEVIPADHRSGESQHRKAEI